MTTAVYITNHHEETIKALCRLEAQLVRAGAQVPVPITANGV